MTIKKNWDGDENSVFKILGSSSHTKKDRELDDYYATDPIAAKLLLHYERFTTILEPACGEGHLSKVFVAEGYDVKSVDLIDRGYGEVGSFFDITKWDGDIITNPPYKYALEFVEHALKIIPEGNKVAMFLKLTFLESKKRKNMFLENPPKTLYVSSSRIICAPNGDFEKTKSSAVAYGWFVWEKGFTGNTIIKWVN